MSDQNENLWPSDIFVSKTVSPASILRHQASILSEKTRGMLEGDVTTKSERTAIIHSFYVVAPALDNYRYELFRIAHPVTLYPIRVLAGPNSHETISVDASAAVASDFDGIGTYERNRELPTEKEFLEWLRSAFTAEQTKKVIDALLAQTSSS